MAEPTTDQRSMDRLRPRGEVSRVLHLEPSADLPSAVQLNGALHWSRHNMHSTTDPTRMLGRHSRVDTPEGVIHGTILAVGAKGVSIAVNREVVRVRPADIQQIRAAG